MTKYSHFNVLVVFFQLQVFTATFISPIQRQQVNNILYITTSFHL